MTRFIARFFGSILLAVAVVFAVGDIARSLAVDLVQLTTLDEAMVLLGLDPAGAQASANAFLRELMVTVGPWPASVSLAILALVLMFLGRPRSKRRPRYAR